MISRVRALLKKGKPDACIAELQGYIQDHPDDVSTMDLLAHAHFQAGAVATAAACLEAAVRCGTGAPMRLRCALPYIKVGDPHAALRVLAGLAIGEYPNPTMAAGVMAAAHCILRIIRA